MLMFQSLNWSNLAPAEGKVKGHFFYHMVCIFNLEIEENKLKQLKLDPMT